MVTGHTLFEGATGHAIKTSILHTDVEPPSRYSPEANGDVDRLIGKTLRRSRDERYQTADLLLFDLRRLWQKLEIKDLLVNIGPQDAQNATTAPGSFHHISAAPTTAETPDAAVTGPITGSSAEYIFQEFKQHRIAALITVAALLVVLAGGSFLLYRAFSFARGTDQMVTQFHSIKVGKLTTTGKATVAGISPDGKYAVHAVAASGKQSLWVRQVAATSLIQLIPPDEVEYQGITFSNDGNYIFYVVHNKDNPIRELHQMPVLGGTPRKIIVDIDSPVTFSPDGNQLAFVRRYSSLGEDALIAADANGQNERKLLTRKQPDFISTGGPAWSPNGDLIACAVGSSGASGTSMRVVGVKPDTGAETAFSNDKWFRIGRVAWLKGGNGLMVNAEEQTLGPYQIWLLPFPSGAARKVTNDLGDYRGLSLAPESGDIVTVQWDQLANIWTADAGKELSKDTQISSGKYDGFYGLSWTGDGKLIYSTNASGTHDVWTMNPDGANQQQLTVHAGTNLWPSFSPDGRYIVFSSDRAGVLHIWRANRDGSDPRQLTDGNGEDWAHCSPDGKWVIYTSIGGTTRFTLWKVPIGGGSPVQLTDKIMLQPDVSPDGKFMACGYRGQFDTPWKLAIIPIEGGLPVKTFDIAPTVPLPIVVRWTADGRELTYIDTNGGSSNLWKQSIDGGPPRRITNFTSDQIFAFDWSPDGKQLVYSRGTSINDVVLISDAP
jgi:Tol biopolymer transport system component